MPAISWNNSCTDAANQGLLDGADGPLNEIGVSPGDHLVDIEVVQFLLKLLLDF